MSDCSVELPQVIIILVILIIIFLFIYKKKENNDNPGDTNNTNVKTSEMYIPNCNFLTDKDVCEKTKGCYYHKGGCRYDWTKLQ